jgi:heme-degrading monooxygenase HmoA
MITLHIALRLKAGRGADLEALYRDAYVPAITRQAGFRSTTLLRAANDPDHYEIDIAFDTEVQRQAWADGADHEATWPRVVAL